MSCQCVECVGYQPEPTEKEIIAVLEKEISDLKREIEQDKRDAYCSALSHAQEQSEPVALLGFDEIEDCFPDDEDVIVNGEINAHWLHKFAQTIHSKFASPRPAQECLTISTAPKG